MFDASVGCLTLLERELRKGRTSEAVGRERKAAVNVEHASSFSVSERPCCASASLSARGISSLNGLYSSVRSLI